MKAMSPARTSVTFFDPSDCNFSTSSQVVVGYSQWVIACSYDDVGHSHNDVSCSNDDVGPFSFHSQKST